MFEIQRTKLKLIKQLRAVENFNVDISPSKFRLIVNRKNYVITTLEHIVREALKRTEPFI